MLLVGSRERVPGHRASNMECPTAVSVEPETRYGKWVTVVGTQMPPRASTGDRDAVLRQIRRCAAVQTLISFWLRFRVYRATTMAQTPLLRFVVKKTNQQQIEAVEYEQYATHTAQREMLWHAVCLSQVDVLSKRLNRSSWFLAGGYSFTLSYTRCTRFRVYPKQRRFFAQRCLKL